MAEAITAFDFRILNYIAEHLRCGAMDVLMPLITKLGDHGIVPIAIALVLICIPKTRRTGLAMGIAFALGGLFGNLLLKNLVGRIRPYDAVGGIELLIPALSDFSFPSGHTLVCFEAATVLLRRTSRPIGITALALAAAVAFSRLYLYVHYPTDVLAGILLGVLFGLAADYAVGRIFREKEPA